MNTRLVGIVLAILLILSAGMNLFMYQVIKQLENRLTNVEDKIKTIPNVETEVSNVLSGMNNITDKINAVELRIDNLESEISSITSKADEAYTKADTLGTELANLKNTVLSIEQRLVVLEKYNSSITGSIKELYNLYNDLLEKYRELEDKVNQLSSGQQSSSDLAEIISRAQQWYFWYSDALTSGDFIKKILDEVVTIPVIQEIISNASISSEDSLLTRIWKVINYTSINLMYRRDSYVRVPTIYGTVRVWADSLQLPNETVSRFSYGGDCEDLALLVYAVLKATAKPGEEVYLLIAYAEPEGHVAVLAIDRNRGEAYIVDPSYSLVNGWAEMIEIEAVNKNGVLEKRYLNPMAIDPSLKKGIFMMLKARIAYADIYTYIKTGERITSYTPEIHHEADPIKVIEIWKTVTGLNPAKYVVVSNKLIKIFGSDEVLASWIAERLS